MAGPWVLVLAAALAGQGSALDFELYRSRVEPIFLKARKGGLAPCYGCHSRIHTRFRLQPLTEDGAWTEDASRKNFEAVADLVRPGDPLASRLLLHPLAVEAGGDSVHTGGKFWQSREHPDWQALSDWVSKAIPAAGSAKAAPALDFETFRERVEPIFLLKRSGRARCYVCHSRGTPFRLQALAAGSSSWNEAQSRKNFEATERLVVPGEPLSSRLVTIALAEEAGGDPFHPGGKHWESQDDPEWRALADWARGVAPKP
ncbi:MAG: hypothetical protein ACRD21_27815 [Vicinamibacteria bacterium]